ncbi:MAG: VOC family protein [Gemmatimonadota bacterium]|nr:VOC family protein [Gemmatimonadota bacterium]
MSPETSESKKRAQPETFRGRALTASITATDLQKSITWYRDVVGFTVQQEHERDGKVVAVSLVAGGVSLVLGQDDGAKGWDRVKGEGISLMITTAQDVDALANGIKGRGGTLDAEPADMPWGPRVFRVLDPDGFRISISSDG